MLSPSDTLRRTVRPPQEARDAPLELRKARSPLKARLMYSLALEALVYIYDKKVKSIPLGFIRKSLEYIRRMY
ncbi:hypothetical protein SD81_001040 [Tolypothrix campylonemoides VB511288]|nr:hypothetical protein SD81_001040 [Tolypothrix campylonemoides VB511288]